MTDKIFLKSDYDFKQLRISGKILADVLRAVKSKIKIGTKLLDLDALARKLIKQAGAKAGFLNYKPEWADKVYPAAICASVNDVVVHGLPSEYALKNSDVVKIDLSVNYKGYFTDAAATFGVGEISADAKRLIATTREALRRGAAECIIGNHMGDIGNAITQAAENGKCKVVKGLTGHGVGFKLHEDPVVLNFGKKGSGIEIQNGMVLAIEPMISLGSPAIIQKQDESFASADGALTAHFEATVAATPNGMEILTPILDL